MMRLVIFSVLELTIATAYAGTTADVPTAPDYKSAIAEAYISDEVDSRGWLNSCVRQWEAFGKQRDALFQEFAADSDEEFRVILEVGNSAYSELEFVYIAGKSMKTNLGSGNRMLTEQSVIKLKSELVAQLDNFHGSASAALFDGNCYFLTVRVGATTRQVAIYGSEESSAAAKIVAELMSLAE